MSRPATTLRVRGIRCPRILIWLRGLIHGKLLHTAGVDPETGRLASGYVSGQTGRFRLACVARRDLAERRLEKSWAEADRVLLALPGAVEAMEAISVPPKVPGETGAQARTRERAAALRAAAEEKLLELLRQLSDLYNDILKEYNHAADQMEATADRLLSCFAAYGHGATLRPVFDGMLPDVSADGCADAILSYHAGSWNQLTEALKEVQK